MKKRSDDGVAVSGRESCNDLSRLRESAFSGTFNHTYTKLS